jgi:hypothetical protein
MELSHHLLRNVQSRMSFNVVQDNLSPLNFSIERRREEIYKQILWMVSQLLSSDHLVSSN